MRQILFKAKRKDNGEWVEGHYAECRGEMEGIGNIFDNKELLQEEHK